MADGLDMAFAMKTDLDAMMNTNLSISCYTDSRSLFDVITRNTSTSEVRLMVDVRSMRESYERMEISDLGWIRSEHNPADALTKMKENSVLNAILDEGKILHPVEQWIIRSGAEIT